MMSEALLLHMMFAGEAKCLHPRGRLMDRRSVIVVDGTKVGESACIEVSPGPVLPVGARIVTSDAAYEVAGFRGGTDLGYGCYVVTCLRRRPPRRVAWLARLLSRAPGTRASYGGAH
ncbi:hypothetical protein [Arenibaculum pallidiluteum]|uniref:hypothetical protein n=1 Tax=Arenibaculum pallidiluteum TaxID=2812559 RepID=UPI001A957B8C|nr:hypothetical protein [Arenibaculum pallidiluteum]